MISKSLSTIFQKSVQLARELRHEVLTIEHVFYLVISSEEGEQIINEAGGNSKNIQQKIYEYITTQIEPLPEDIHADPFESVALARVIDTMIKHIQSSSQSSAEIGDFIVSIYDEKHSYAYKTLQEEDISRLDILEVISHKEYTAEERKTTLS